MEIRSAPVMTGALFTDLLVPGCAVPNENVNKESEISRGMILFGMFKYQEKIFTGTCKSYYFDAFSILMTLYL